MKTEMVTVRFTPEEYAALKQTAAAQGRSLSNYIVAAVNFTTGYVTPVAPDRLRRC